MNSFIENITILKLFIVILGNWRISSLVANENGPFHIFKKFREWCAFMCNNNKFCEDLHLYELVECEWCNSIWFCGFTVVLWFFIGDIVLVPLLWLCLSACVIFVKFIIQNLEVLHDLLTKHSF